MSYVKGDTSHVQGTLQGPWCVFMLPNICMGVGLLNSSPILRQREFCTSKPGFVYTAVRK